MYGVCRNLSPAECDKKILELASRFTLYGLDFHDALVMNCWYLIEQWYLYVPQDHGGIPILLGVSGFGIAVFCGEMPNLTKLNHFPWYA